MMDQKFLKYQFFEQVASLHLGELAGLTGLGHLGAHRERLGFYFAFEDNAIAHHGYNGVDGSAFNVLGLRNKANKQQARSGKNGFHGIDIHRRRYIPAGIEWSSRWRLTKHQDLYLLRIFFFSSRNIVHCAS
jgi:hypothetical protein